MYHLIRENVQRIVADDAQCQKFLKEGFRLLSGLDSESAPTVIEMPAEMNLTELKALAKERGIEGYASLTKEELLMVLKGTE